MHRMKERRKQMATSTIRLDDGVREETTRIASQMGLHEHYGQEV